MKQEYDEVAVASAGPYADDYLHSLQTDNHTGILTVNFYADWLLFLMLSQQCQSTEYKKV